MVVGHYNRLEGRDEDESPFAVVRRQEQLDAALLYVCTIDLLAEELAQLRRSFQPEDPILDSDGQSEWSMVRAQS
jgi:hypothetical protein